jgi:glycosyltransferase involved in cell wall biosynthesis
MRIAYVFDQLLPRTAADTEQVVNTVSALGRCGVQVDLILPRARGAEPPTAAALADWYDVEPTFGVQTVPGVYPAHRGLEKVGHALTGPWSEVTRSADFVYTRNVPTLLALLSFAKQPVVYEHFRPWPQQSRAMAVLFGRIARLRRAPALVMHSEYAAKTYWDVGFSPARTLVAHNGWDPRLMEPALDRDAARAQCGIDHRGPVVVYSGHVNERKGLGTLLALAQAFPAAKFVLVGSEGRGAIEIQAEAIPNVEIRPWCSRRELVPFLYAADILALPPSSGPLQQVGNTVLPLKTFIYLAAGRAIFGGDTPDVRELLRDGVNARLVRPDDHDAARTAMAELLDDATLRERLASAAKHDAADLTWAARGRRIAAFLEGLS